MNSHLMHCTSSLLIVLVLLLMALSFTTTAAATSSSSTDFSDDPLIHDEAFINLLNKHAKTWIAGKNSKFEGKRLSHAKRLLGLTLPNPSKRATYPKKMKSIVERFMSNLALPDNYNVVNDTNYVACKQLHHIRNQLSCGSCWAFSISEMVADRFCIASKTSVNTILSPQWMVSCDTQDNGCNGGEFDTALNFVENTGLVTDSCVPYQSGTDGYVPPCPVSCANGEDINKRFKTSQSHNFDKNDLKSVQSSILAHGPLVSGFKVYRDFYNYKSGVYKHIAGGLVGGHAIKVVGWGVTPSNVPYWIVANSWSDSWGMNGYFWIYRGSNECDIEENFWGTQPVLN